MWLGSAFHADVPACENARSANLVLSRGSSPPLKRTVDQSVTSSYRLYNVREISWASSSVYRMHNAIQLKLDAPAY